MRLRKPEILVVNVDSVASASTIAQVIKFNYTTAIIKGNQTKLIIIINIAICLLHLLFSRHHGMTLQYDVRNDVVGVIKNAYVTCMCPILTPVTIAVPFPLKYRVIRPPSMRRRNVQLLNMDRLCHINRIL